MWQRFTERARKAVFYAQEEAQKFGEGYVSTEHLLLGILREADTTAGNVLIQAGLSLESIRKRVESQLPRGDARPSQDMTLTPRAKRVIDLAYEEARELNHNYIGTEHLLLGLIREGDGLAARVLASVGAELVKIRALVRLAVGLGTESLSKEGPTQVRSTQSSSNAWLLLSLRRRRMIADLQCLIFLGEEGENAHSATLACGVNPRNVVTVIEEAILVTKSPGELVEETLTVSDLLSLANLEAKNLNQDLNGAHFLLAALAEGSTATAKALVAFGIRYDEFKAQLQDQK